MSDLLKDLKAKLGQAEKDQDTAVKAYREALAEKAKAEEKVRKTCDKASEAVEVYNLLKKATG